MKTLEREKYVREFTLIELLVVIAIIAILASMSFIGIPTFLLLLLRARKNAVLI